ncbi:HNH nuclease [Lactiplantibacillus plantarum]|nr:HNH nuclease [Lactiplantibacillus plantarum]MCG0812690.1 HNH nuclease [Lactiplantibacillus plantarum]MCG0878226.1 HNH nuclease [Lactiplantibacillus plantarum]MCG0951274.1 HNH nuclease [Lactiplantibacillus plantarum]
MAVMIHSKYGYEPPEWVQADARLDRWYKDKKRRAKQHGAFSLDKKRRRSRLQRMLLVKFIFLIVNSIFSRIFGIS